MSDDPLLNPQPVTARPIKRLGEVRDDRGELTHVMCCICFAFTGVDEVWRDRSGQKYDLCSKSCADAAGMT